MLSNNNIELNQNLNVSKQKLDKDAPLSPLFSINLSDSPMNSPTSIVNYINCNNTAVTTTTPSRGGGGGRGGGCQYCAGG